MKNSKKRAMLNRMNTTAREVKLGNMMPIVVSKTLASGDISSSKASVDMGTTFSNIVAVTCITAEGALRAVTKAVLKSETTTVVEVTATSMAATDVLTVTVI